MRNDNNEFLSIVKGILKIWIFIIKYVCFEYLIFDEFKIEKYILFLIEDW